MIEISQNDNDSLIIKRTKKSLTAKFNPNSEKDIDKSVMLANYLVAIDRFDEAKALLNSCLYFRYLDKPEKHEHLWSSNAQGLILLSYIESHNKNYSERLAILKEIILNDYNDSANETHFQKLLYDYRYNEAYLDYYKEESHKYRCEILSQECLTFLYWKETWEFILINEAKAFNDELDKINSTLGKCYSLLKEEIINGK